jgi:hypothetical protein
MIRYKKNSRQGSSKIIEVDGKEYQAKYIGKGQFSKVFRVGDRVVYYTQGDCSKEVLAMFQYDRMAHLPELIRHENITMPNRSVWYVFSSPYYRNVTMKDKSAYQLMKKIIRVYGDLFSGYCRVGLMGIDLMQAIVDAMRLQSDLPRSVIKALQEIVYVVSNCGSKVGFDFQKSNFGVNEYGTLIFRDPVWVGE